MLPPMAPRDHALTSAVLLSLCLAGCDAPSTGPGPQLASYCQRDAAPSGWEESPGIAIEFMGVREAQGIIDGGAHVYRKLMKGAFDNKDVLV